MVKRISKVMISLFLILSIPLTAFADTPISFSTATAQITLSSGSSSSTANINNITHANNHSVGGILNLNGTFPSGFSYTINCRPSSPFSPSSINLYFNGSRISFNDADGNNYFLLADTSLPSSASATITYTATGYWTNPNTGSVSWLGSPTFTLTAPVYVLAKSSDIDYGVAYNVTHTIVPSWPSSWTSTDSGGSHDYTITSVSVSNISLTVNYPSSAIRDRDGNTIDTSNLTRYRFTYMYTDGNPFFSGDFNQFAGTGPADTNNSPGAILNTVTSSNNNQTTIINNKIDGQTTVLTNQITQSTNQTNNTINNAANDVSNAINQQTTTIGNKIDSFKSSVDSKLQSISIDIKNVVQGILNLPDKIEEMLIGLIVPDQEELEESFNSFSDLAESKLGIIWQVPEMVITFLADFIVALRNTDGTFLFPSFELDFMGDKLKLWDDYTVNMQPEGMEGLFTYVKLLTSITLLINFVNGLITLKDKFFERR